RDAQRGAEPDHGTEAAGNSEGPRAHVISSGGIGPQPRQTGKSNVASGLRPLTSGLGKDRSPTENGDCLRRPRSEARGPRPFQPRLVLFHSEFDVPRQARLFTSPREGGGEVASRRLAGE